MSLSTWEGTSSVSFPKSRPVSLLDTLRMTDTALSLRTSGGAPVPSGPNAAMKSRSRSPLWCRERDKLLAAAPGACSPPPSRPPGGMTTPPPFTRDMFRGSAGAGLLFPAPAPPCTALGELVLSRRQLMRGSCTKASSMAITESLLSRSTRSTLSLISRKLPSMPLTSIALTSIRVNRKGIFSGNFSRCMATSKQSPKSIWRILPV
mmetsp:Transcript_14364/g.23705  ORF Transcript_14364/g.23705 Transcript_14364/m.23705 type:complete len:206 (+) Transcript_14364:1040-1657(+)